MRTAPMSSRSLHLPVAALLFVATLLVFRPALSCDFINLDDPAYVQNNPILHGGLTLDNIGRTFTTVHAGYWIPLTWISYLVDYHISALNPLAYHRTNVLLHALTAALLFLVLTRMTRTPGRSFVVAALFAVHPIQVESVAWVTERKDVLSTLFLVLSLWAYARYVEQPSIRRYLFIILCFVCGLMAKPMLVTLPVMLLLLDRWPLDRQSLGARRLLLEKVPLFLIALVAGLLTIWTQKQGAAVRNLDDFTLYARLGNAVVSYAVYLRMLLWPYPLAVFYPHPGSDLPVWEVVLAASLLTALTTVFVLRHRQSPHLLIGWLWYVVALAPVSGILQAGWQGRADRFLYVSSIGLFLLAVWSIPRKALPVAGLALIGCMTLTTLQLRHWRDSLSLWEHTCAVTEDNFTMRDSLAAALMDRGRAPEAVGHLERARELKPDHELSYYLLGVAARAENRLDDAALWFGEAQRLSPQYVEAHIMLAEVRIEQDRLDDAEESLRRAMEIAPRSAFARSVKGMLLERQGRMEEALGCFRESVRLDPHAVPLRIRLIEALWKRGLDEEAVFEKSVLGRLYPGLR